MPNLRPSITIDKRLFAFLDDESEALSATVRALSGRFPIHDFELRADSCPANDHQNIVKRLKPELDRLRQKGFGFTLHASFAVDESERLDRDIIAILEKDAMLAVALGIPLMTTHAAFSVGSGKAKRFVPIGHLLPELDRIAKENGIRIAIENISLKNGKFQEANDPLSVLERISNDKLESVGIAIDFGHALSCGSETDQLADIIRRAGSRLFHIHAHESGYGKDDHAPLAGRLDWNVILRSLGSVGYSGAFVFEMLPDNAEESLAYLDSPRFDLGSSRD